MTSMESLSERQKSILKAVVIEYIAAAEPISSEFIAQNYELGVRSATIRNELAEITELGFLDQPHTSAGRIPSDGGYRYYVDHMILQKKISIEDRKALDKSSKEEETTRELVSESIKALSRTSRLLTAAITVRDANAKVSHAVVTALGPDRALLVVVMANGHTENRVIECPLGLTLDQVGRTNSALESSVAGKTLLAVLKAKAPSFGNEAADTFAKRAFNALKSVSKDLTAGHIVFEGEEFIIAQPEYIRDPNSLSELVDSLGDEDSFMAELGSDQSEGKEITIGRENRLNRHRNLSFIRRPFKVGDNQAGIIAVIGPTRMNYDRNIALLDFTADAISATLTKLFS